MSYGLQQLTSISPLNICKGFDPEMWRYQIGAWRFFYGIDDKKKIVYMVAASHRISAY
jgi:mRNA interferase RelE/StbE